MKRQWMLMLHGYGQLAYDEQGGKRGATKTFSSNMVMLIGTHPLGRGTFGFRSMVSLEPLTIGKNGYPLLLQSGETADGRTPLIDRQHPHDLMMELAATLSLRLSEHSSAFAYFGLPGEPALGPPVYMHRFSGEEFPVAPITHHWLDSSHITYGAATLGVVRKNLKLEGSVFNGRESDQFRYDIESPNFDSYAFRLSWNPQANLALQMSFGHLRSPEQLEPEVSQNRLAASALYNKPREGGNWQTLFAWGRNIDKPGRILDAFLVESALAVRPRHTFLLRAERVEKDVLFQAGDPLAGMSFTVREGSLGYIYDVLNGRRFKAGLGGLAMVSIVPGAAKPSYGGTPLSGIVFLRLRLK